MRIGSEQHKELFCRWFMDSHEKYEPVDLAWPELEEDALARLRTIPFWSIALQTEQNAGLMLTSYATTVSDSLIREAIALQGYEEARHARMIGTLIDRYGLDAEIEEFSPKPTRRAFIDFGYKECIDSFIGFGAFRLAREAQYLPQNLIELFRRVLSEEARHIVFFVNWVAYDRAQRGRPWAAVQTPSVYWGYLRSFLGHFELAGSAKRSVSKQAQLRPTEEVFGEFSVARFIDACLKENEDDMAAFDPYLLRPVLVPRFARILLGIARTSERVRKPQRQPGVASPAA
ncbi:MAG: ferritin-like domain-containing protein [Candidatus Eremiobacteraeota bacterium]|nr:ferritin-like domain-containing protein [Candidatus Eremiobacteraeota bacterium]